MCGDNLYMKQSQTNHIGDTIRIRRPSRIKTDELGHNVWLDDVEPGEFEIVSEEFMESIAGLRLTGNDPRNSARATGWPCRR